MTSVPPVAIPLAGSQGATAKPKSEAEALKSFEAVFLSQMVDEMMKTIDMQASMGEHSAEMWRSVVAQALADGIMEDGGLGIAQNIQNNMDAYKARTGDLDG